MKINYKNTCLHFLEDPEKMAFYVADDGKNMTEYDRLNFGHSVRQAFPEVVSGFKENVRLISASFRAAYIKGKHKLVDVWDSVEFNESGTFIIPGPDRTNTIFYMIITNGKKDDWQYKICINVFTKLHSAELPGLDVMILETQTTCKHFIWKEYLEQGQDAGHWIAEFIGMLTFIKFCDIETKVVNGGKRDHHVGTKYVNETKTNVLILDSTWFTNLLRTEGFGVTGHFRLQPYGPGLSQRKLIYIHDYQKQGYTRVAKKISTDL